MKIFLIILLSLIFVYMLNYIIFRRSMTATIIETLLRLKPKSRYQLNKLYNDSIAKSRNNYSAPKLKCHVDSYDVDGMPVYELYGNREDRVVVYLHGGAYVAQPMVFQWNFATKLANKANARVIIPMYPLAPEHTYDDAFDKLTQLYKDLVAKYGKDIIIIGDSAGGGLELALGQYWQDLGIDIPKKIIMLSPWLDISLVNADIPKYKCADPMLSHKDLQDVGALWAGDIATNDSKVSPMYGKAPNTQLYIFVGTREILCPDCIDYYVREKQSGANIHLILGVGMNHVYPMYPIPEACKAFRQIKNIIESK